MIAMRSNIDGTYRKTAEAAITRKIIQSPEISAAGTIATWASYRSEVNTYPLITHWLSEQKQVVIPKVIDNDISFFSISQISDISPGYKGVPEPTRLTSAIDPAEIDVCIVPGLAFDISGHRLGYGKGFYDRFLTSYSGPSIGICFTNQLVYSLPHNNTDIPVKSIITDTVSIQVQ